MAAPVFPQAMYREVAEKSQDFLLPGVDRVLPNTITLVETNAEFVEAFMAGLNHEMARELLWRGFPTDQRGSYFRQFWDPSGRVSPPADPENLLDIKRMHQWFGELGSNGTTNQTDGLAVLLIRGDLLRRYPHAMIYAHKADWVGGKRVPRKIDMRPEHPRFPEKYPIFQGALPPDINFVGFSISSDQLVGDGNDAGYFFVLQEQPTEPRFGLDESPPSDPPPDDWDDLSWEAVRTSRGGYIRLSDGLPRWPRAMSAPFSQPQNPPDPVAFRFDNANSAHLAFITMQKPLRVMIHASDLIGAR